MEQPAPAGKEAPKDKDAPALSKEGVQPGKEGKQTTSLGMGDSTPAGKAVDFATVQVGAAKGKPLGQRQAGRESGGCGQALQRPPIQG